VVQLQTQNKCLEELNALNEGKVNDLSAKLKDTDEIFKRFNAGSKSLDKVLEVQRVSNDRSGLGYDDSSSSLLKEGQSSHEKGKKETTKHQQIEVNTTPGQTNFKPQTFYKMPGYIQKTFSEKFIPTCHYCGEKGHIRPNCFQLYGYPMHHNIHRIKVKGHLNANLKKNIHGYFDKDKLISKNHVNSVNTKTRQIWIRSTDLYCMVVHTALKARNTHMWYLDSGCSRHMSGDKSLFTRLEKYDGGYVTFGDGSKSKVVGKGSVQAPGICTLENVLFVDGLKANLISISQMCDSHHEVIFSKDDCFISDISGSIVMHGTRTSDNCYGIVPSDSLTCHTIKLDEIDLWHQRLGHINYKDLSTLANKELIRGVPKLSRPSNHVCGPCQLGKQTKAIHKKSNTLATSRPLELLHMDLMGPSRVESIGRKKYIFVIVDDFSRFTWVRFLREKSDTLSEFKSFVKSVQNERYANWVYSPYSV
jgi:hypothetical protein